MGGSLKIFRTRTEGRSPQCPKIKCRCIRKFSEERQKKNARKIMRKVLCNSGMRHPCGECGEMCHCCFLSQFLVICEQVALKLQLRASPYKPALRSVLFSVVSSSDSIEGR